MKKVLVIDEVHDWLINGMVEEGFEVSYRPEYGREDLIREIPEFDGLIVRTKTPIDKSVLSHAVKLKFIGRAGAGLDNVDLDCCEAKGIVCFNAGESNADAVGEQAVGMLLALYARIVKADKEVRSGIWDREGNRGRELKGSTIGIIGYGNTGKAVASKLKGFGVKVLAYDKYLTDYGDENAVASGMEQVFNEADVLSFHVPLTPETYHLGNKAYFSRFMKPVCVLNLSRGPVVKLDDLVQLLEAEAITGAALDVLENEKISQLNPGEKRIFDYLSGSDKVVLTPHIGGWTKESYLKISRVLLQKIKELRLYS